MNSKTSSAEKKKYEKEFSEFLIKRIGNAGGSLQLQHISGHFSQVRNEVRYAVGTTKLDLIHFLKNHNNLFIVRNDVVSLVNSSTLSNSGYDSDSSSSIRLQSDLPPEIENGKGVIVKIFPEYGFIKSKEPIKTEVYFRSVIFGSKNIDLTSFLYIGTVVFFHARQKSSADFRSKYQATKVWKADESGFENNTIIQKSRKSRETGLYDPLNLESEGIIQNVFPNLGFIAVKGDDNNTVFFYKNRVVNYDNIVDLTKVLSKGDMVEFHAHRSTKPDAKARWEATKVWKISGKIKQNISKLDSRPCSNQSPLPNQSVADIKTKAKEMKKNQRGKICPRSHGAVIKFGGNELADGDSAAYYVCGTLVTEIGWEFSEGDDVFFDAVKIRSAPGWKAVLVWVGDKPDIVLPTCLGDFSEFTDEEENEEIFSSIYTSKSSSYMSGGSTSSSLKSMSIKSESNTYKTKDKKEKTRKIPDFAVNKEIRDSNKKLYKVRNTSQDSLNSFLVSKDSERMRKSEKKEDTSQDNVNSHLVSKNFRHMRTSEKMEDTSQDCVNSFLVSKKSQHMRKLEKKEDSLSNKFVNAASKTVSDWGDSPYPVDEAYENIVASESCKPDIPEETVHSNMITEDEVENISEDVSSVEEKTDEINDEFLNLPKIKTDEDVSDNNNLKDTASIKRFHGIKGKVNKVYSKFAEVKSCNLQNTVSFFWNDFYSDGMSVEELELDDLKQILKVGDSINFNYFIIVDDLGQSWQRVTMAWSGCRPKNPIEMSPEDFIKQHTLSVTVNNELDIDEMQENRVTQKKFLTSFVDVDPNNSIDKLSRTESCSEEESLTFTQQSQPSHRTVLPPEFKNVSNAICQMLKKDVFSLDSEVDLNSVSEEIINIILESHNMKKSDAESSYALSEEGNITKSSDVICSKCHEKSTSLICEAVNKKNCEVQTIITGDIIAQNIFTDC